MKKLYIPIILGTARENRQSERVANFVRQETEKFGLETEIIDVHDFLTTNTDNTQQTPLARKLAQKLSRLMALSLFPRNIIMVTPES